ncbi:Uncharacterised protein [Achromobacter spanius]|nr:hypothetical protein CVS48_10265 [Achromobacter spanius]SPT37754.1 Uncharacterised protein [Achromobacter denitrificans]VEE56041.1 Uncharacterised protein [Achromobacter spanius]
MALGMQSKFNWKGVATSALGAGVTAGVGAAFNGANVLATNAEIANAARGSLGVMQSVARAAVSSTVSQGIAVATGLQSRFNWTNVAAAGIGAGVGSAVSSAVLPNATVFGERMTRGFVAGAVGGVAATVLSGGKADYVRIATDAFGNALGNAVVDAMQDESSPPSTDRRRSGQGIRVSEQDLAAFVRDPLSMDDGGLPLARLRAGLPVNGSESPTYTSGESENDLYSALVRVMSEDKPRHQGVLLADNGGNNSAAALEALALARKGVAPNESWGGKGAFFYGLKEGRANRSVMDTEPVSMAEKLGALTRDFVVGAKDALVEMPLMAVDTARLTDLAATAVMTGRAEEFQPWSDTGKFAKDGGTLGEYYAAPFSALGHMAADLVAGDIEAAGSGAAGIFGGVIGGRGSRVVSSRANQGIAAGGLSKESRGLVDAGKVPSVGESVTLYRVDDAGFTPRILEDGTVPVVSTKAGGERTMFVNLGQPQRAKEFARINRGGNATITAVEVDVSLLTRLRQASIYDKEANVKLHPSAPLRVDVNKAPDQFGLRTPEQIQWLRDAIRPGTARVVHPDDL